MEIAEIQLNVGLVDCLIRLLLASALFYSGLFLYFDSNLGIGLDITGGVILGTALFGFCGFYRLLGICTNPPNESI